MFDPAPFPLPSHSLPTRPPVPPPNPTTTPSPHSQTIPNLTDIPRQQQITRQRKFHTRRLPPHLQRQPLILHPIPNHTHIPIPRHRIPKRRHHQPILQQRSGLRKRAVESRIVFLAIGPAGLEFAGCGRELHKISKSDHSINPSPMLVGGDVHLKYQHLPNSPTSYSKPPN